MKKISRNSRISIGRRYNNKTEETIVGIEIRDDDTAIIVAEILLSMKDFGKLVSGSSDINCVTQWNTFPLDKKRVIKTETVKKGELDKWLVDGWTHLNGYNNYHNLDKNDPNSFIVTFVRYEDIVNE